MVFKKIQINLIDRPISSKSDTLITTEPVRVCESLFDAQVTLQGELVVPDAVLHGAWRGVKHVSNTHFRLTMFQEEAIVDFCFGCKLLRSHRYFPCGCQDAVPGASRRHDESVSWRAPRRPFPLSHTTSLRVTGRRRRLAFVWLSRVLAGEQWIPLADCCPVHIAAKVRAKLRAHHPRVHMLFLRVGLG